ncbi:hypothetical protein [Microbaculum marinum]|uniref:ABM domain-containing protein n=1 Tax=Microbaculum marinum TaxID=1764581 RepID=A0AAW9S4P5_9HYPH
MDRLETREASIFAVVTRVKVKPGKLDECAALFRATNASLIELEHDWVNALFLADRANSVATIVAIWRSVDSYNSFIRGNRFSEVMQQVGRYFDGEPETSVNEVLVDMSWPAGAGASNIAIGPE